MLERLRPTMKGHRPFPPEGSEDAWGPIHPRGLLRDQRQHGPVGAGAPQSAPGTHVQVIGGPPPFGTLPFPLNPHLTTSVLKYKFSRHFI